MIYYATREKKIIFQILLMISGIECFTFKIGNGRLVKYIFPEKEAMIYENPIIFRKLVKSDNKEKFYYKKLDRQSKGPGSNPDTVECDFFSTERFRIL